ncbi:MAG: pilus assembly protein [Bryobacterales bacterium]|nr:pilus assembly protein [Bryobacterales bacterium]
MRARRSRRGGAIVEGALALTVIILMFFGLIDFGRLMFTYNSLAYAAQQAARYASVHGSSSKTPATLNQLDSITKATMIGTLSADLTTTVTWTPNADPGSLVSVQVTCAFRPLLSAFTRIGSPLNIKSSAGMTITN